MTKRKKNQKRKRLQQQKNTYISLTDYTFGTENGEYYTTNGNVGIGEATPNLYTRLGVSAIQVPSSASNITMTSFKLTDVQANPSSVSYHTGADFDVDGGSVVTGLNIDASGGTVQCLGITTNATAPSNGYNVIGLISTADASLTTGGTSTGIFGSATNVTGLAIGLSGNSQSTSGNTIGVHGYAQEVGGNYLTEVKGVVGSAHDGYDTYGGWFSTSGTNGNISYGIYADNANNTATASYAIWANGDAYSTGLWNTSDAHLKLNITRLINARSILNQLQPKSFEYDTINYPQFNLKSGLQYGLVAQEVQQVLPSYVKTSILPELTDVAGVVHPSETFLSVNYVAIVPLLIEAVNDAHNRIDSLINVLNGVPRANAPIFDQERGQRVELKDVASVILNQNDPNPFTESTRITYIIPQDVINAKIIFTNASGMVINTVQIKDRGFSELQVFSSELGTGIYTYTLVCDGKIIDSKKMIKQ